MTAATATPPFSSSTSSLGALFATPNFATLVALAFALRVAVGLGPYSGAGHPPKFGDYEAQRHWMELAIHLKPSEW